MPGDVQGMVRMKHFRGSGVGLTWVLRGSETGFHWGTGRADPRVTRLRPMFDPGATRFFPGFLLLFSYSLPGKRVFY